MKKLFTGLLVLLSFAVATPPLTLAAEPTVAGDQVVLVVNINKAPREELQSLPGIGPIVAGRIIEFRQQGGVFSTAEELKQIKGIGTKTMAQLRSRVTVD